MVAADGTLAEDTLCLRCGYNLRKQPLDGRCPECAHPVESSVWGRSLKYSAPAWIRGLGRGVVLILLALAVAVFVQPVVNGLAFLLAVLATGASIAQPSSTVVYVLSAMEFLFDVVIALLAMYGLYLLTQPDPALAGRELGLTARLFLRRALLLLVLPPIANLTVASTMPLPAILSQAQSGALGPATAAALARTIGVGVLASLVALVVYTVVPVALLAHLQRLMARIPRPGLARFARVEFWGLLCSLSLLIVGLLLVYAVVMPLAAASLATAATATAPTTPSTAPTSPATAAAALPTTTAPAGGLGPRIGLGRGMTLLIGGLLAAGAALATVGFAIAGVVLLIMACRALFATADEAARRAAQYAATPPVSPAG